MGVHRLTGLSGGDQSFYDPVREELKEPRLTGTSYSFTDDGYYEEAVYLAISNREVPGNETLASFSLLPSMGLTILTTTGHISSYDPFVRQRCYAMATW